MQGQIHESRTSLESEEDGVLSVIDVFSLQRNWVSRFERAEGLNLLSTFKATES